MVVDMISYVLATVYTLVVGIRAFTAPWGPEG
jgi:hypothetical protein